jgi:hypothetical protein
MEQDMTDIHSCSLYCDRPECIKAQRDKLRDKLAQPAPVQPMELVRIEHWQQDTMESGHWEKTREMPRNIAERRLHHFDQASIIAVAPAAQRTEPFFKFRECEDSQAGIVTPPQRTWVKMTNDEWSDLYEAHHDKYGLPKQGSPDGLDYERAIEAKLMSKNEHLLK